MYKLIIRPVLFLLQPESVHHLVVLCLKIFYKIPGISLLVRSVCTVKNEKLTRNLFGLTFNNPVGLAAGFDKNAEFYNEFSSFGFSFIEIGTVTPKGQPGNPKPRSFRLPLDNALINRMGFNNLGADKIAENLKKRRRKGLIIGGNLGKNTNTKNENAATDYLYTFEKLQNVVDYFVINVSCPNISDLTKLQDKDSLLEIVQTLTNRRKELNTNIPILLKISPDLNNSQIDDVLEIVKSFEKANSYA